MIILHLKLSLLLLSWLISVSFVSAVYNRTETLPGCPSKCGDLDIPYPFGIGEKCAVVRWTKVNCNTTFNPPKAFLGSSHYEIAHLSPTEIRIKNKVATSCYDETGKIVRDEQFLVTLRGTPYTFSSTRNKLFAIGCDTFMSALLSDSTEENSIGCASSCEKEEDVIEGSCSGIGCCELPIPQGAIEVSANAGSFNNYTKVRSFDTCGSVFLAENDKYIFKASDLRNTTSFLDIPVVLNFAVGIQTCKQARKNRASYVCKDNSQCYETVDGIGYLCNCSTGYEGNPYLKNGCRDINECEDANNNPCQGICTNTKGGFRCSCPSNFHGDGSKNGVPCERFSEGIPVLQVSLGMGCGFLVLLVSLSLLYFNIKKRKLSKLKEKFFQRNGGLLLKQQIASHEGGAEMTKIFTSEELKLATNDYDEHRILGQGGSGTVYKGTLPDQKIVAIKKSKIIDESQIAQFINEVIILTQVNHRNVVKLLGCCLETEVPVLVYEFVSNGTLFHHLHKGSGALSFLYWKDRLRISSEVAAALAYLHSAASIPIIHRDVKSVNILLDEDYISKVSDFGASRLNLLDETRISTLVQGTIGYLDPDYFLTGQLTEKSDVYSFGVVLVELLTGEKPLCFDGSQEQKHLATYFMSSMKEAQLFELLEGKIVDEQEKEQVRAVARLARRCLNAKGEDRPFMKEVAAELERLRGFRRDTFVHGKNDEFPGLAAKDGDLYVILSSTKYSSDSGSMQHSLDTEITQSTDVLR